MSPTLFNAYIVDLEGEIRKVQTGGGDDQKGKSTVNCKNGTRLKRNKG